MKTLEMTEENSLLVKYAKDTKKEPVILTIRGKPVAALVPIENADSETVSFSTNLHFLASIERSRARLKVGKGYSTQQVRNRLGLKRKE